MGDDNKVWVNGERIAALEAGQETILETLKEHNKLLLDFIGPEGRCTQERVANEAFKSKVNTHINGLWTLTTFTIVMILGIIIDIVKKALTR